MLLTLPPKAFLKHSNMHVLQEWNRFKEFPEENKMRLSKKKPNVIFPPAADLKASWSVDLENILE